MIAADRRRASAGVRAEQGRCRGRGPTSATGIGPDVRAPAGRSIGRADHGHQLERRDPRAAPRGSGRRTRRCPGRRPGPAGQARACCASRMRRSSGRRPSSNRGFVVVALADRDQLIHRLEVVDVQLAVEVVELVLEGPAEQTAAGDLESRGRGGPGRRPRPSRGGSRRRRSRAATGSPRGRVSSPLERTIRGLTSSYRCDWTSITQARSGSPSWGAARPTPGASRIVSARSSSRWWRSLPKLSTGSPRRRSRGSPRSTMGWTLMVAGVYRSSLGPGHRSDSGSTSTDHGASGPPSSRADRIGSAQDEVPAPLARPAARRRPAPVRSPRSPAPPLGGPGAQGVGHREAPPSRRPPDRPARS